MQVVGTPITSDEPNHDIPSRPLLPLAVVLSCFVSPQPLPCFAVEKPAVAELCSTDAEFNPAALNNARHHFYQSRWQHLVIVLFFLAHTLSRH